MPPEARSLTLLVEDHDAKPAFVHWKVTGITPSTTAVAAGGVPPGGTEAANGRGRPGYTGPCPPPTDPAHHYVFRVQALDAAGTVVAEGRLTALYKRGG